MLWNKLSELGYYTAKGAGFKVHKPNPLDLSSKPAVKQLAGFDSGEELERTMARIRGTA